MTYVVNEQFMSSVVILGVIGLNVVTLSVENKPVMPSVVNKPLMPSVVMLNVIIMSVVKKPLVPSVVILSVVMPSVVAPKKSFAGFVRVGRCFEYLFFLPTVDTFFPFSPRGISYKTFYGRNFLNKLECLFLQAFPE